MPSFKNSDVRLPIMEGSPPKLVPPRLDWDRPPWNRWSFQHVREILPTAEIWRGYGPVRALPRADADLEAAHVGFHRRAVVDPQVGGGAGEAHEAADAQPLGDFAEIGAQVAVIVEIFGQFTRNQSFGAPGKREGNLLAEVVAQRHGGRRQVVHVEAFARTGRG